MPTVWRTSFRRSLIFRSFTPQKIGQQDHIPLDGDGEALACVVSHYQHYIKALATRPLKDEYGNEYLCVDEDMRLRLEAKLIRSIVTSFKVLSA